MKKLFLFIALLMSTIAFSQVLPIPGHLRVGGKVNLGIWSGTVPAAKWSMVYSKTSDTLFKIRNSVTGNDSGVFVLPNGYMGIGTNAPTQPLDVLGNIRTDASSAGIGFQVYGGATQLGYIGRQSADGVAIMGIVGTSTRAVTVMNSNASTNIFQWANTANSVLGVINNIGNVGLNTTLPATRLHSSSSITTSPRGITSSQHNDGTEGAVINLRKSYGTNPLPTVITTGADLGEIRAQGYDGANYLDMGAIKFTSTGTIASTRVPTKMSFWTATDAAPSVLTERMTILPNGNVGIGNNNPAETFVIGSGNILFNNVSSKFYFVNSSNSIGYNGWIVNGAVDIVLDQQRTGTPFGIKFRTNNLDRMYLNASGNLGIGTILPTELLSLSGQAARKIWMERHTTANTAGNTLTLEAGGATVGATDKDGGNQIISSGIATGLGKSDVILKTVTNGATGTTDRTATDKMQVLGRSLVDNTTAGTGYDAGSYIDITPGTSGGMLQLMIGDGQEYVWAIFTSAAVVTLITNSANVVNTNTDAKFCIVDNGSTVRISNALGSTLTMSGTIIYNN